MHLNGNKKTVKMHKRDQCFLGSQSGLAHLRGNSCERHNLSLKNPSLDPDKSSWTLKVILPYSLPMAPWSADPANTSNAKQLQWHVKWGVLFRETIVVRMQSEDLSSSCTTSSISQTCYGACQKHDTLSGSVLPLW